MIKEALLKLIDKKDLNQKEAEGLMRDMMNGKANPVQIGAALTALRSKGETIDEITSFAKVMRDLSNKIYTDDINILDTCGTGGDMIKTSNVSTTSAFVVAGLDIPVAKHGNRSVTSKSGSADVLEYLGLDLRKTPKEVENTLNSCGICFAFAPVFHPAMKHAIGPRKSLGIRTVFNILGPLTNPAEANHQILGVYDPNLCETMAKVLSNLGTKHALVVHGIGGLDEVSTFGKTKVCELNCGEINTYHVTPKDFGIKKAKRSQIEKIADVSENARDLVATLNGQSGPLYDLNLVNSAAALKVAMDLDFAEGIEYAKDCIESGKAFEKLKSFIKHVTDDTSILDKLEATL